MTRSIARTMLVSVVLFALGTLASAPRAQAAIVPLRSGTVISKTDVGTFTAIKVMDDAGKKFWILTTLCVVGENARIDVLAGAHYDKVASDLMATVLEDVYTAQLLKIGDLEVKGFGTHELPAGCVTLR